MSRSVLQVTASDLTPDAVLVQLEPQCGRMVPRKEAVVIENDGDGVTLRFDNDVTTYVPIVDLTDRTTKAWYYAPKELFQAHLRDCGTVAVG